MEEITKMAITRVFDEKEDTVQLFYGKTQITYPMKKSDPAQILNELSGALESAYQKLRNA